jgi:hypothetical protein
LRDDYRVYGRVFVVCVFHFFNIFTRHVFGAFHVISHVYEGGAELLWVPEAFWFFGSSDVKS